jgi:hypothetical protein
MRDTKFKKDKIYFQPRHKQEIIKLYKEWKTLKYISEKLWYKLDVLYNSKRITPKIIYEQWKKLRRCSVCNVYRIEELDFHRTWKWYVRWNCIYCNNLVKINKYRLARNIWDAGRYKDMRRRSWQKNWWKYNLFVKVRKSVKDILNNIFRKKYKKVLTK